MTMDQLLVFWKSNADAIIVSLIVGLLFFILGPIGVWFSGRKIRRERIGKAKEMLVDLVEGMIVTQEDISAAKLKSMFNAVEREVDVDIGSLYDLERLFEDVMLRFQRSKHLDASQKDAYSRVLSDLAKSLSESANTSKERLLPRPYERILADLKAAVDKSDTAAISTGLEELEEKLIRRSGNGDPYTTLFAGYRKLATEHPLLFTAALIFTVVIYAFALYQLGILKL